ncbi:spindle pole body component 110-like protein [Gossypium australe]|uniref:Spindle pole body component 110-like protein n=1 Tax=Gossypium australe TaxID=47621 RepID=A0A5B6WZL9_9ROSI|nr:spindle pole body component 110-like protein [Gossypium australe]
MEKRFLDKVEDNAAVQIWPEKKQLEKGDSLTESYSTVTMVDLVPTVEEYTTLLQCPSIQADKAYSRAANVPTFLKKLMSITWMSEQWVAARIKQNGDSKCIFWKSLRDLILAHLDIKKRVDVFALSIYGLVIFPKALGHIDEVVSNLFDRLDKNVTPIPAILSETFRYLNACRRAEEKWMAIIQNLQDEDIEWRALWMVPDEILYRCGDFNWVHLLGIWGAIGYTSLLVLRQYRSRQFIPATQGLAQCEFAYKGDNYKKKKLEAEKMRKGKNNAEEDLDSLKTDYKKLCLSIRSAWLGKTSEQGRQEIKEEKIRADRWEKKFEEAQVREEALERSFSESRNEKIRLKA